MCKKILILVEGQTEEKFIKNKLSPYFHSKSIFFHPTIICTKRTLSGAHYKGGINSFEQFSNDLSKLFYDTSANIVTSMIDYYALPSDFPGYNSRPNGTAIQRVEYLEAQLQQEFPDRRFLPYIQLHEFEALVLACPNELAAIFFESKSALQEASNLVSAYNSPEEINEGYTTAPSKRLEKLFPEYKKTLHGDLILGDSNIDAIRAVCPHFNAWLTKIEQF